MLINSLISDNLQLTIIRHPLIVNSEILLPDMIALINEAQANCDSLSVKDTNYFKNLSTGINRITSQAASCVLVMEKSQLVGIITQRDLIKLTAQGKNLEEISVAQVMTRELITLKLSDFKDVFTALHLLRQHRICHLPIVGEEGELIGLVTPTSLLAVSIQQAELYNYTRVKLAEQQKIEAELRLERNFVSAILNLTDALVIVLDFQGRIVRFNHTCEQATGYAFDEIKGRFIWDVLLLPEITECIKDICHNLAEREFPQRCESCLVTKNSDRCLISWSNKVLLNQNNQVEYIVFTGIDITESRKTQEELQQTRNFLQSMIHNLPVAVFVKDAKPESFGIFKLWNNTCENIFGITPEQAIGKTDYEFFPKEQADIFRQKDLETFDRGVLENISEETINSPSFGKRILHTTKIPLYDKDKQPEYLLFIFEDITEYKGAEKNLQRAQEALQKLNQDLEVRVKQRTLDLQKSEAELRAIFNQAAVGIKLETLDGHFLKANQKLCEMLGYSQEEILNKNFRDITHPEDIQVNLNNLQELVAGDVEIFSIEKRYLHKNGDVIWVNLTVSLIRDPIGKPIYVIGVVKDIREQQAALRERRKAEENIRKALEKEKELSELKSRFISMTSHEFRTPLAVIASSAGILKSFSHKLDEQQKQKHLQCIQTYSGY